MAFLLLGHTRQLLTAPETSAHLRYRLYRAHCVHTDIPMSKRRDNQAMLQQLQAYRCGIADDER